MNLKTYKYTKYSKKNKSSFKLRTKNVLNNFLIKLLFLRKKFKKNSFYNEREFSKEFGSLEKSLSYDVISTDKELNKPIFKIYNEDDEDYLTFSDDDL